MTEARKESPSPVSDKGKLLLTRANKPPLSAVFLVRAIAFVNLSKCEAGRAGLAPLLTSINERRSRQPMRIHDNFAVAALTMCLLSCCGTAALSEEAAAGKETGTEKSEKDRAKGAKSSPDKADKGKNEKKADKGKGSAAGQDTAPKEDDKSWEEYLAQSQKYYADGKLNESYNELELALAAAERLKSDGNKADAFLRLGEKFLYHKKYENAKALMEEGLKMKRKIPGFKTVGSANALDNLAQAYSRTGELDSASKFELEALGLYESMHKTDTHDYAIALSNHANTLRQQKKYKDAEQFFAKAVAVQQTADAKNGDSEELAKILLNAGGLYCEMNKLDSAKRLLDRASKIIRSKFKPEHPLYMLSIKSERVYYKKLVDSLLKADANAYRPDVAQAISHLAGLYEQEDDLAQASSAYKQAIGIQEKLLPEGSTELKDLKDNYAACMKKLSN